MTLDLGNNNIPGATSYGTIASASIEHFDNADASNKNLLYIIGSNSSRGAQANFGLHDMDSFNPLILCSSTAVACADGAVGVSITSDSGEYPNGISGGSGSPYFGPSKANHADTYFIGEPLKVGGFNAGYAESPLAPSFADVLPPPESLSVASTGSGSLSSGTYCMEAVGVSAAGGQTLPGPEVCQTVSASSSISLQWLFNAFGAYSDWYLYYGTAGSGSENMYVDTAQGSNTGGPINYTFTTTSGASGGSPLTEPTAYLTYFYHERGASCILCSGTDQVDYKLGVGETNPPSGDKLAIKGGVLDAENGFKSALTTKSTNYTLTTSDYWVNVTGTTTITVPHASTGNHWVVFNSGSNTVTVQADSGNINGAANVTLAANTGKEIACDGTNCFAH